MKRLLLVLLILPRLAFAADTQETVIPLYPNQYSCVSGTFTNHTINASNDSIEFIVEAENTDAITDLMFRYGARGATPCQQQISIQGVSTTTGRADGTIKSSGNAKATFTPPADTTWDGTVRTVTLTSSYTPSVRGERLALVIADDTGDGCTPDGTNNSSYTYQLGCALTSVFPYSYTVDAGTGTARAANPIYGLKTASDTFGLIYGPTWTGDSFDNPNTYGFAFTIPSVCSTLKLRGVRWAVGASAASKTYKMQLFSGTGASDTTVAAEVTIDADQQSLNAGGNTGFLRLLFDDTPLTTLTCGSGYRIGIAPQETSSSWNLRSVTLSNASDFASWPWSTNVYKTTRGAGNWTDTTTVRPIVELIVDDITSSGGGGLKGLNSVTGGVQ